MLQVSCPITGAKHSINFGSATKTNKLQVLHPLLLADYAQLLEVPYPHAPEDQWILFCAFLYQVNFIAGRELVKFSGAPNRNNFSTVWLTQTFPHLRSLVNKLERRPKSSGVEFLAGLRVTKDLGAHQVQTWITTCLDQMNEYSYVTNRESTELASYLLELNIQRKRAESATTSAITDLEATIRYRQNRSKRAYIEHCLSFKFPAEKVNSIAKVIFRPNDYEIMTLRQVKVICLELLHEDSIEQRNIKDEILLTLDQILSDKLALLELLDAQTPEDKELHDELKRNYTIDLNGTEYHNGIIQNKYGTSSKQIAELVAKQEPEKIFTSEPKREDYTSELGYQSALRIYNRQQATRNQ